MTGTPTTLRSSLQSARHQHGTGALRALAYAHDAEALRHLGIGLDQTAEVAAESIFIELFARLDIPQAARVRGNLIGHHDAHDVVFPQPSAFHLEVDETDADTEEDAG